MLNILNVTSEVVPFSKTGGLADVSSSLPEALAALGHTVSIITPLYSSIDRDACGVTFTGQVVDVILAGRLIQFGVYFAQTSGGVKVYLLENHDLFSREGIYGTRDGAYGDNHLRFAFFCASVFEVVKRFNLAVDVLHCHDWQSGLVPLFNRLKMQNRYRTVMTVHNMGYQGTFPGVVAPEIGIPWDIYTPDCVEFWGQVSFLKAGLVYSDRVTTVSPRYAREVLSPEMGYGMDGILRSLGHRFSGILNGVDYTQWNPATDPFTVAHYSADNMEGKSENRASLLAEFGLTEKGGPLYGVVGRLAYQKGYDLLAGIIPDIVAQNGMLVVLGTGERAVEEMIQSAAAGFPDSVSVRLGYSEQLAHMIEAGSDFFLMPSRYEPCGLNQMYSLRYGTIPIVHAVGGLDDTVIDVGSNPEHGTGIKFTPFEFGAFQDAVRRAGELFRTPALLNQVRLRGMALDFSWKNSAARYAELYDAVSRQSV